MKGFCYNARLHEERDDLRDKIDTMIPDDIHEEVIQMGKTMAEHDREVTRKETLIESLRSTLLRLLQRRFGEIPEDLVEIIEGTKDQGRLDGWLDRFATADRLEDVGIG